ncbi:MAG: DUF6508 domain-containing protein [Oscillospiraceae bacterium]|nr:DUF6508 domain-containing protein [Oscillospiraceae bacterium]
MSKFNPLTKYIPKLQNDSIGTWDTDLECPGTPEHPIEFRGVNYSELVGEFCHALYRFCETNPEFDVFDYQDVLSSNGISWDAYAMASADVATKDATCMIALLMGAVRAERFCEGALLDFFHNGSILRWLKRLQEIDKAHKI